MKRALIYAPVFLILLTPALFNRFPLVHSVTGTYLASAMLREVPLTCPVFLYQS